jgi:ABC-type transporter MlaC component
MLRFRVRVALLATLAVSTFTLTSGSPGEAERIRGGPLSSLEDDAARIVSILRGAGDNKARLRSVDRVLTAVFDLPEMARLALVDQSPAMTASEHRESVALLTAVFSGIVHRFAAIIAFTNGAAAGVELAAESLDGDRGSVFGQLLTKRAVPITAQLRRDAGRWRVYDLSVDGIGMVASYRAQVAAITLRAALPGLTRQLEAKRDELASELMLMPMAPGTFAPFTDATASSAP